jgi:aryl-alcohol dehydrogenase-like predicted oxidoreductase
MALQLDNYRLLGRSGLRVSPLSLGAMTFGVPPENWGSTEEDAQKMFDCFVERGGNFLDTANFYGGGGSERMVGRIVKGKRDGTVIATKYTVTLYPKDANAAGNHRKSMVRNVEESLRRLDTDYIDLLYLHMWDFRTPVEEILRAFDDLVRAGKILYVGLSDTPAWQASRMQAIAELRGWAPIVALQISYSLMERTVERDLIPMAAEMGMGVLPWSPLGGGVLAGKYSRTDLAARGTQEASSLTSRRNINLATNRLTEKALVIADEVKKVASELGRSPAQIALAWTLLNPAVVSPIIGARTFAQFEDNLAALDVEFSPEQIARLDEVSRVDLGFPHAFLASGPTKNIFGAALNTPVPRRW